LINVLRHTRHKIGHFGDILCSQSLGTVLKKRNLTQQKQTTEEQNSLKLNQKKKQNSKPSWQVGY